MNDIAKNIRKIRKQKGITQDALAAQLHVTRQAVSNWETGKNQPDLEMLESISKALGAELTELFYGTKSPEGYQRFQRHHVVWTAVLGVLALQAFAYELFLKPLIKNWTSTQYRFELRVINDWILLPIGCIAAGMLVFAVISLWRDVQPGQPAKLWLRIAAFVMLIPVLCFAVDAVVMGIVYLKTKDMTDVNISVHIPVVGWVMSFFWMDTTGFGLRLACTYLPFLSGLCLYPAFVARGGEKKEAER